jgi:sterol 3beta-glucosyltransferase
MRIAIQTLGTRGDVQPYVALALGLMREGHTVQMAAPVQYGALPQERGVPFAPLPGDFLALIDTPEGKAAIAGGEGFSAGFKLLKHIKPLMRDLMDEELRGLRSFAPDIIIYHPKSIVSPLIADALNCAAFLASPLPGFTPTSAFPTPMLPFESLGLLNRASHLIATKGAKVLFRGLIRDWLRASFEPDRQIRERQPTGTLYAYSPHVVPVPPDWGPEILVSGYWFLDNPEWQMPRELAAFLDAGAPPVYFGFGSTPGLDPDAMTGLICDALAQTGNRGILATGRGALRTGAGSANVYFIAEAPHDRLFPHVASIVHHGGAGTTGASLRGGKPMAICPFFGDQPFWARRVAHLGVGPAPLDRKILSPAKLANVISQMEQPAMRQRAAKLGAAIQQEDGLTNAVRFVFSRVGNRGTGS